MNQGINGSANFSAGISSLTTGSTSGMSGSSNLRRSMSMNTNSTTSSGAASMGLPASPLSFSSSNVNVPGSSALVCSSITQQGGSLHTRTGSQQDLMTQQQLLQQSAPVSANTSQLQTVHYGTQLQHEQQYLDFGQQATQACEMQNLGCSQQLGGQITIGMYGNQQQALRSGHQPIQVQTVAAMKPELHINEQSLSQLQALAGAKLKREELLQHQLVQNMFHRPESLLSAQIQRQESLQRQQSQHIQAQLNLLQQQQQQQRFLQHQQILQSLPQHLQRYHLQQQQQQLQHHLQQQMVGLTKQPACEYGTCARRLMQYIQSQRMRPPDNNIKFWREFVAEYFAPHAKMRWCVSLYGPGGRQSTGVFPQDLYHCDICHSNPGRGFEATLEVLPRLFKIKYDNGELDELLFVDVPHEYKLNSGITILEYGKAVHESLFQQLRVVRDGKLRVIFTPDLKIVSWDFCAIGHEELLSRRTVVPQVNQLAQLASKYQNALAQNTGSGISPQDLQTNCNMFVASARQLAKNLEAPINEIGFTKIFVRCLQISEVVNSMKDLIDFSSENNLGPMESLAKYHRSSVGSQSQPLQRQDQVGFQSNALEHNSNKLQPMQLNIDRQMTNNFNRSSVHANTLASFQSLLRQNSNSQSVAQKDHSGARTFSGSGSFSNSLQASPTSSLTSLPTSLSSLSGNPQQPSLDSLNQQNTESAVHQLLQEMMSPQSSNSGHVQQGQKGGNPRNTGLQGGQGNPIGNIFPDSGAVGMSNGDSGSNAGIMGNSLGSNVNGLGTISGSLTGNTGGNGISISNCLRNVVNNSSALGNVGSMNALGSRMNLTAIAQQQKLQVQGETLDQHDFSNGLNSLATRGEFNGLPLNWKS
eukprot:c28280_g1_i2 orf=1293-3899(+)